ncbi:RNA chaperone Hfq [Cupriavidus campinensis]|uniref:LSM domain-containing protein n=1 Tax=Cupriavidus campinensis TaxID=151783 RepID=A0ABY3ESM4_9BURK|nr:RNA chaperone Hfq [Cupriavidus campinensis]TSP13975.1 hypothetical protein FGG12_05750 [Cupriavidus campinensis]
MMTTPAMSRVDAERRIQEREGQRLARSERSDQPPRRTLGVKKDGPIKPTGAARGHEAFLNHLQASSTLIKIIFLDDLEEVVGRVHTTDKYTITLAVDRVKNVPSMGYDKRVIFKHAIREFRPIPNVPEVAPTTNAKAEAAELVEA